MKLQKFYMVKKLLKKLRKLQKKHFEGTGFSLALPEIKINAKEK